MPPISYLAFAYMRSILPHLKANVLESRQATIRALFLEPIVNELIRLHVPVDDLLSRHGFGRADLRSPYSRVSLRLYIELMEDAAGYTGNPYFGLDLGSSFQLQQLGPFYALMSNADNLRTALNIFARFQSAWQTRTSLLIARDPETTSYTYAIEDAAIWPRHQDAEFTLGAIATLIRQLGMPRWSPRQVEFEHAMTMRGPRLRDFFKAPVTGNARFNRLTIDNADLDRPQRLGGMAEAKAMAVVERHLRDLLSEEPDTDRTLCETVTNCVAKRLGRASVEFDIIAKELSLSTRSLRRKLDEEGTSFREILQAQRLVKAEKLLCERRLQISELAAYLGYSDVAVFSRAFKAWTGSSPRDYIARSGIGAPQS
jgi:AraC-like DNA-binding protein